MLSPSDLTMTEAALKIRNGELSALDLMDSLLNRIQRLDQRLQAWEFIDIDKARTAAYKSQEAIDKHEPTGRLHGIPLGVKDIFYTTGMPTEAGASFWSGFIPQYDATCISRIQAEGGIILGKTVTTQFADGDPARSINPWNAEHTPGGSSTGSAVAVAARMIPAALGSQTVGSVLRPAAYNGVVGFKPSYGRISKYGVVEYATSFDHVGFIARSVEDTALLLSITEGLDSNDPSSVDVFTTDHPVDFKNVLEPPTITVLRGYFSEYSTRETLDNLDSSVELLRRAGATIHELDLGVDLAELAEVHNVMVAVEAAQYHGAMFRASEADYGPRIASVIQRGMGISADEYGRSSLIRKEAFSRVSQLASGMGVMLTPTASEPAPRNLANTGDLRFQSLWSFLGFPSISLPSGISKEGLPFGLQFSCGYLEDLELLECASWAEKVLGIPSTPPGLI